MLDTAECHHPVQWNAAAGIVLDTLLTLHRIELNSATGNAVF
jgi:hypothetical protein